MWQGQTIDALVQDRNRTALASVRIRIETDETGDAALVEFLTRQIGYTIGEPAGGYVVIHQRRFPTPRPQVPGLFRLFAAGVSHARRFARRVQEAS